MRLPDPEKEKLIRLRALEMVVEEGLDGFSMQKLAKRVKISPSTLYVYFADREDLLFQLFDSEMTQLKRGLLEGMRPQMPFAEGLGVQWRNRIRYALGFPLQSDFLEQIRHSPYHGQFVPRIGQEFYETMRNFVSGAVERGELRNMPVELYWSLAFAPLYQLIQFHRSGFGAVKPGCGNSPKTFVLNDGVIDLALEVVVKGLAPDAGA